MTRKQRHAGTSLATLRPEMPTLRRMPAPSRLPEFDAEAIDGDAPSPRRPGMLRGMLIQLSGWARRS